MRLDKSRICVSVAGRSADSIRKALARLKEAGIAMAEIRLDVLARHESPDRACLAGLFGASAKAPLSLIATCRPSFIPANCNGTAFDRKAALVGAIEAGADFVDIEIGAPDMLKEKVMEVARSRGARTIISFHNYSETPCGAMLRDIKLRCFDGGADIAKIACMARSEEDCERLIALCDTETIAIGMGAAGRRTRIMGPILGSPFTFASMGAGKETAPGQPDFLELLRAWRTPETH
jgi:3-dehydroquinate dehydratase-1